jgi:hypothetical protein
MKTTIIGRAGLAGLLIWGLGQRVRAAEPTAFDLVKEGNHYVSDEAKDKLVRIHSEKSVGSLTPNIWYIVYYDKDATFKSVEVKFGAGKKLDVKRPMSLFERMSGDDKPLERKDLKIDSDKALATAEKEPLLEKLTLKASQMWLDRRDGAPVWKVRLWAAKLRHPNDQAEIGDVYISAEDGKVVERDLHINRVD